jgi:hypothetical protein
MNPAIKAGLWERSALGVRAGRKCRQSITDSSVRNGRLAVGSQGLGFIPGFLWSYEVLEAQQSKTISHLGSLEDPYETIRITRVVPAQIV